jgi:poly(hydroxyalkanoate) depolymerase family esterase
MGTNGMNWSRELREAGRTARDALRAISEFLGDSLAPSSPAPASARAHGIMEVKDFGSNPGNLRMLVYAPSRLRRGAPLIAVLHGCAQTAVSFAEDAGWVTIADRLGFPLLMPEQVRDNNHGGCFNWFQPEQSRRGRGEALSIRQMVAASVQRFGSDPRRMFIVGLSAGGAMAAALMAAYPDVFAAGAVLAGLPVGCATSMVQAFSRMAHAGPDLPVDAWAGKVRGAAPPGYRGRFPRISIWHGGEDNVVDPANAGLLARQWTAVHGLGGTAGMESSPAPGVRRRIWGPPAQPTVELWTMDRLRHAYPINGIGRASEWVAPAPVSATDRILRFWDLP